MSVTQSGEWERSLIYLTTSRINKMRRNCAFHGSTWWPWRNGQNEKVQLERIRKQVSAAGVVYSNQLEIIANRILWFWESFGHILTGVGFRIRTTEDSHNSIVAVRLSVVVTHAWKVAIIWARCVLAKKCLRTRPFSTSVRNAKPISGLLAVVILIAHSHVSPHRGSLWL